MKQPFFYCEFASVHLPFILQAEKSERETSFGDSGGSGNQEQPWKGNKPGDKAAAAAKSSPKGKSWRREAWETRRHQQPRAAQNGNHEGDTLGRQGGNDITTIWRFRESACREIGNQHAGRQMKGNKLWREILGISMQGDKWRETTEEAVILGISMQGDKGRETNEEAVILGISMQGDKWRREILEISMQGDKRRETNEEGRLGAAAISVISMQGDKWRETNEEGRLGAAAISVISMQGDKLRETNEEGRLGAAAISVISNPTFEK